MQRLTQIDRSTPAAGFAADVRQGLGSHPRALLPQYFYDALGSSLFDAICNLPEYYPTRCETEILTRHASEIVSAVGSPLRLVELGSGGARKTRLLFDAILPRQAMLEYVAVDVDPSVLEKTAQELLHEYEQLEVTAVSGDFRDPARVLAGTIRNDQRNLVLFLGSTIGNLDRTEAVALLRGVHDAVSPGDSLLLGADLVKPAAILEAAYDDPLGVTSAFNRNLLVRINRELDADFDIGRFRHRAFYDSAKGRIEMHLVSTAAQTVRVGDDRFAFAEGETIHTENSHKYDLGALEEMASDSGFRLSRSWTDARQWFADVLLVAE